MVLIVRQECKLAVIRRGEARRGNPLKSFLTFRQVSKIIGNIAVNRFGAVGRNQFAFNHIEKPGKRISGLAVETAEQVA